jgi:hypothetical protein
MIRPKDLPSFMGSVMVAATGTVFMSKGFEQLDKV